MDNLPEFAGIVWTHCTPVTVFIGTLGFFFLATDLALHVVLLLVRIEFLATLLAQFTMWGGVNHSVIGYPALVHAAGNGYASTVKVLLSRGASVRAKTKVGLIGAADVASKKCYNHIDVMKLLDPFVRQMKKEDEEAAALLKRENERERANKKKIETVASGANNMGLGSDDGDMGNLMKLLEQYKTPSLGKTNMEVD
jgi:hypothetical protein